MRGRGAGKNAGREEEGPSLCMEGEHVGGLGEIALGPLDIAPMPCFSLMHMYYSSSIYSMACCVYIYLLLLYRGEWR